MKVGVLKIGARISFSSQGTSGGTGEALSIIKMLQRGGAEVVVFTKVLSKDINPPEIEFRNIANNFNYKNIHDIDILVVVNGTVGLYGGAEDPEQLLNYAIINSFPKKVVYLLCDPELTLKQVWPSVAKKEWASNWSQTMLHIGRSDIIFLSQPHDVEKVMGAIKNNEVMPSKMIHFPFEKFPCLNPALPLNATPEVDLSYGGTMRNGRRAKKMVKYYFGLSEDISVEMFGKIQSKDFNEKLKSGLREPIFTGPVRYDEMLSKMNKAMAHVVIGDPWYEKINDIPQRLYESVNSSVVTFVDSDMDKIRRVWTNDKTLGDFLYVSSRKELEEKLMALKTDSMLRSEIVKAQFAAIDFDELIYCNSFTSLLNTI